MAYRIRDWHEHFENNRTRDMKRMGWVPIPNRMDGAGYTELLDHPNGAAHLGAWLAIVEIASRRDVRGTLPQEGAEIPQALARISRIPAGVFEEVLPRLLKIQWIERVTVIPQEGAEIPQAPAPRARVRTEQNGMEQNGTVTAPPPLSQSEYPLTIAEIRKHDPAVDDFFVLRLVQQTTQALQSNSKFPQERLEDAITDKVFAAVCRESYAKANGRPHGTGLLLSRVPAIMVTWGIEAKNG